MDKVRTVLAPDEGCEAGDPDRQHVATLATLATLGWHVTEIRPDGAAPTLWSVTIERYDGIVEIIVINAADPDAALEELARYAAADAADAEDPQ